MNTAPYIERVTSRVWPQPTPTNAERLEDWRRKYVRPPIEIQCAPIHKHHDMPADDDLLHPSGRALTYSELSHGF